MLQTDTVNRKNVQYVIVTKEKIMSNQTKIDLNSRTRRNPSLREGTWKRLELYAQRKNLDGSGSLTAPLEKLIHDHCDFENIPNPFNSSIINNVKN